MSKCSIFQVSNDASSLLREVAVRVYHEPDVDWWIQNRRKSYYSMNSIDHAALINTLKLLSNDRAELVTTHQARDGFDEGASPPHLGPHR